MIQLKIVRLSTQGETQVRAWHRLKTSSTFCSRLLRNGREDLLVICWRFAGDLLEICWRFAKGLTSAPMKQQGYSHFSKSSKSLVAIRGLGKSPIAPPLGDGTCTLQQGRDGRGKARFIHPLHASRPPPPPPPPPTQRKCKIHPTILSPNHPSFHFLRRASIITFHISKSVPKMPPPIQ
jgi:hypothetical protein